ncbi:glycosyltransferase family 31 protein [Sporormia fimetaria CBS 119925]|uniref:N-acetylgalactosaminide beta-1,3-galactosyltransferase n=1 Tax=Sporormia fimetaria CBS 119925 TaxID=1340428 RepID=A0A6A6V0A3_9PLEO|nr:glycosyltransferase family 31 protein [Sporormia fimetaria CBS 119925]
MVRLKRRRLVSAVVVVTMLLLFYRVAHFLFGARGYDIMPDTPTPARSRPGTDIVLGQECSPFSSGLMDDVTVVLKLGDAEVRSALPAYLDRIARCRIDLLIFSDHDAEYNGYKIIDALRALHPEYKYQNPDFDIYDRIQAANGNAEKTEEGWRLDKYKFLPMMEITAHKRPESNWFIFVELDTYVNWDNMYRFLSRFNPKTPYHFGSPVWPKGKTVFAHGGSGFVLSRGAMNRLIARGRMFAENHLYPGTHLFGKPVSTMCCGDEVLAHVLKECGVSLRGYWPMFNGEKPASVRFGWEQWCESILTMHHLQDHDFDELKSWEAARKRPATPFTFEELFSFIEPHLIDQATDWSNLSEDKVFKAPQRAAKSVDHCLAACKRDGKCMQYEHFGDTCRLSYVIRLGHSQSPEGSTKWVSGWIKDRVQAFKADYSPCDGPHFVHANPK